MTMNDFKRTDRVAELIQRKLSMIIQREVKDPRLSKFVTITGVKVSSDLSYAKIYFTVLNEEEKETSTSILKSASKYLRKALARTIQIRKIPELKFIYDEHIEYGNRLSRLIDKLNPPANEVDDE